MTATLKQTEQVVMLAILRKQPDAYGVSIYEELETRLNKAVPMATIYATLETLEKKDFVKSKQGQATAERGGRAKMFFEITGKGQMALNSSLKQLERLRQGTKLVGAMAWDGNGRIRESTTGAERCKLSEGSAKMGKFLWD